MPRDWTCSQSTSPRSSLGMMYLIPMPVMEPICPLNVFSPKEGRFQSKQWSFGLQVLESQPKLKMEEFRTLN